MNINKLIEVLEIQTETFNQFRMFSYLIRECVKNNYSYYVHEGNIYVTKGEADSYHCIVSHMDSVHEIESNLTALIIGDNITGFNADTMEQIGIGGDDKVGVFMCLQMLEKFDNMKAVFFRDEECGCVGSNLADLSFFDNCKFVLQCDRKGNGDLINNASGIELCSKYFTKDIKNIMAQHGYKLANGFITDVMQLKSNGLQISACNISCGYFNPHMYNEYVNIFDVENCLNFVSSIFENINNIYPHKNSTYKVARYKTKKQSYIFDDIIESKKDNRCFDCWTSSNYIIEGLCPSCYQYHNGGIYDYWAE